MPILCSMPEQRTPLRSPLPQPPFSLGQELGHDEQADAARAGGGIGELRQNQMDDVLGQVMLAGADEDLGAVDAKAAVPGRHGLAPDQAEIGAALRLGEAHGARPRPVGEPGQEDRLQPLVAVPRQGIEAPWLRPG